MSARRPRLTDLALLIVVALTVYAAVTSQLASNKVANGQQERDAETACTSSILFTTVDALDSRTEFSTAQAQANVDLQRAQLKFFGAITVQPPPSRKKAMRRFNDYLSALNRFLDAATQVAATTADKPYPTPQDYMACLRKARASS